MSTKRPTIERLSYQEADMEEVIYLGSAELAFAANEKLRLAVVAKGADFMPFKPSDSRITRFKSHEEANAHWDDMVARRVRIINGR